ncbi:MAG: two-component system sensor histidine kinase CreC [Piscinibacter sp.]|uniref:two-component system sensor histidine kinase CreC n=1 Tax=Piscinibacter sp. TaxID=1903157 RepID=UPI001B763FB8|nr:two-component system sensor histidine kinase CreC [Piscinibacter sp.]MBP5991195.1 two-component system sensor histidine kinase CreC [Piscinibacter sp.]MBP6026500.1 two-component system sensor histidine kinase CreC [Piscinibacter sp.]
MKRRSVVFIGILLVYALGVGVLMYRLLADIDPRYRESAEESLVETAHLLASEVEQHSADGRIDAESLRPVFRSLYARSFSARIFDFEKTGVELQALVLGRDGIVLFDSIGQREGEDFSQWRDVRAGMAGEYRARTTPRIPGDELSSVMYVSAPVRAGGEIVGVVSVGKPVQSLNQFVAAARRKTMVVGATSVAAVLVLALILSLWLVRPFGLIADYVRYVRAQRSFSLPRLGRRALGTLGAAYDEMRDALAGRHYVADYVQTLTHELKSPLSAIRGAAELMQESGMPEADRQRFIANIGRETQRIQELVDRMMELAALEQQRRLPKVEPVSLRPLLEELAASAEASGAARGLRVELAAGDTAWVEGEAFLLRRALGNLLANALEFSPDGGTIHLALTAQPRSVSLSVRDHGPGIPDYADERVFEKFYSLARPATGKKSTGLGLAFVKEIAELHHGRVTLRNADGGGALATLSLPRIAAPAG